LLLRWSYGAKHSGGDIEYIVGILNTSWGCQIHGWDVEYILGILNTSQRSGQHNLLRSTKTFLLVVQGSPPDSLVRQQLLLSWPFGAVHPIHQHENNCFCAARRLNTVVEVLNTSWGYSIHRGDIQYIMGILNTSQRSGQHNRLRSAKTFPLVVQGSPPDSLARQQLLFCWPFGAVHPIHRRENKQPISKTAINGSVSRLNLKTVVILNTWWGY
jgi:hypothetical protein